MFIEILFKMLLFKGGVLIYAEYCLMSVFLTWQHVHISVHLSLCELCINTPDANINILQSALDDLMKIMLLFKLLISDIYVYTNYNYFSQNLSQPEKHPL